MTGQTQSEPLVSVVLQTYNHEAYVAGAIDSVLMQEASFGIELIVTEDRSTDGTWAVVESYLSRGDPRIRALRSDTNLNSAEVTTRALRAARGTFIAYLDGDDHWTDPRKLAKQVAYLRDDPFCSMCYHDVVVIDHDAQVIQPSFRATHPAPPIASHREMIRENFVAGPSPMYRASALRALPEWFDALEFGDWALYLCAAMHGHLGYLPDPMAAYRVHAGGYWSGKARDDQFARLLRFHSLLAERGPEAWRAAFRATCAGIEAQQRAAAAGAQVRGGADGDVAERELDVSELAGRQDDGTAAIETGSAKVVRVGIRLGDRRLGTLDLVPENGRLSQDAIARAFAGSSMGWEALLLLFDQTVMSQVLYSSDDSGWTAWRSGAALAGGLPEAPAERRAALYEKAGWSILLAELIGAVSAGEVRTVGLMTAQGLTQQGEILHIDVAQPFPRVLAPLPSVRIALALGGQSLNEVSLEPVAGVISAERLRDEAHKMDYALARAAILEGVVGFAAGDPRPLRDRLKIGRRERDRVEV
ncbi:glycosyltransferase [Frigidibacter sp. MR17.14]|uniref:glycosyltransferase n=1 Tax=Frigidibacter sp. MR17.14 TaxID=3126509 RepID=UPI0030130720